MEFDLIRVGKLIFCCGRASANKPLNGPIAHLGERLPCKQEVASSSLAGSTIKSSV